MPFSQEEWEAAITSARVRDAAKAAMALLDRHVQAQEQRGAALDWAIQATVECASFSPIEYYAVMHLLLNRWLLDMPTPQDRELKKELALMQMIEQSRERQLAALLLHLGSRVRIHAEDLERACTATLCSRGPLSGAYLELWVEEQKAQELGTEQGGPRSS